MRGVNLLRVSTAVSVVAAISWLSWRMEIRAEKPSPSLPQLAQPAQSSAEVEALKSEIERLKGMVPDQAHAMKDVGYHYANLWFAGQKKNWPLAEFFWAETRSHLRWAVRIIPVRKDPQGTEVRLGEVLDPIEKTSLEAVHEAIVQKDAEKFTSAYKQMLDSCYACHVVSGKQFLRLEVPQRPETSILRFEPEP